MLLNVLKGKIHRARVVQAELDYVGSITVDTELARAAGILEYEKVQVSTSTTATASRPTSSPVSREAA